MKHLLELSDSRRKLQNLTKIKQPEFIHNEIYESFYNKSSLHWLIKTFKLFQLMYIQQIINNIYQSEQVNFKIFSDQLGTRKLDVKNYSAKQKLKKGDSDEHGSL